MCWAIAWLMKIIDVRLALHALAGGRSLARSRDDSVAQKEKVGKKIKPWHKHTDTHTLPYRSLVNTQKAVP